MNKCIVCKVNDAKVLYCGRLCKNVIRAKVAAQKYSPLFKTGKCSACGIATENLKHCDQCRKVHRKKYNKVYAAAIPEEKKRTRKQDYKKKYYSNKRNRIERALRTRFNKFVKKKQFAMRALIGCDNDTLLNYIESKFSKGMEWDNYGKWHIDHIKPCAKFDLTDTEQQKECFNYSNLQPLWASDNIKKGATFLPSSTQTLLVIVQLF